MGLKRLEHRQAASMWFSAFLEAGFHLALLLWRRGPLISWIFQRNQIHAIHHAMLRHRQTVTYQNACQMTESLGRRKGRSISRRQ